MTVASRLDRPVLIHTSSTGCAACRAQHREFAAFDETADSVVIVDLSIDPNEDDERLRTYAADGDYDWHFAVSTDDLTRSLIDDFGQEVTSSAASPVIVGCGGESVYRIDEVVESDDLETVLADRC